MSLFLSPCGNSQFFDANGAPLNGGKVYTYLAGSSTPVATYTDNTGANPQSNPINLNSLGMPTLGAVWLTGGVSYKFVVKDSGDVTLATLGGDNIAGINDATNTASEWVDSGLVPTRLSATSFSVPGDQTDKLQVGRRVKTANTAGIVYSRITASSFTTLTTVTVVNDSGALDSGLSAVSYGLLAAVNRSLPSLPAQICPATTAGTSTAYTITPTPAITAYAAGQSFFVTFSAASGAAPTLAISGIATPPNLVKQNGDGTYSNIAANDIPVNHRSRVTLLSATQALVEMLPGRGIGPEQTWQNVTTSRAFSTNYTNSTPRPITVVVTVVSGATGSIGLTPNIDGVSQPYVLNYAAGSGYVTKDTFIVPSGSIYSVTLGGSGSGTLGSWFELRN